MRLERWDCLVVGAITAVSAAVFLGAGGRWAEAEDPAGPRPAKLAGNGAAVAELGGCQVWAEAGKKAITEGDEAAVTLHLKNPGQSPVELRLVLTASKIDLDAMSRVPKPRSLSAAPAKPVSREVALTVEPAKAVEETINLKLPAGMHTVTATVGGKTAALCTLNVAAAPAKKEDKK